MDVKQLIHSWFTIWENGNFEDLPIAEHFMHVSPYGVVESKQAYMALVHANKEKFLGHKFEIHDIITTEDKACIRYTAVQDEFSLEVTEWHYMSQGLIEQIVAYYNIPGEIRADRKIDDY